MTSLSRSRTALAAIAFAILSAPVAAFAQDLSEADAREVSGYVLTDAALANFVQATENLDALPDLSAACDDEEEEGAASLDAVVARITETPGAQAAIESAGMTPREYVVFSFSLLQNGMAAWGLTQPGGTLPPGISQGNVDFYNSHQEEFAQLGDRESSDPCGDGDETGYEEE
jgi:hypothetical protein